MTDRPQTPEPLTREAIKSLRAARSVVFRSFEIGSDLERSELEVILSESPRTVATLHVGTSLTAYGPRGFGNGGRRSAFEMIQAASQSLTWQTVARIVKAGDVLRLRWIADNNTDNIREAGLHCDELHLQVFRCRKPQDSPRVGSENFPLYGDFMLRVQVGPDNSARMTRP